MTPQQYRPCAVDMCAVRFDYIPVLFSTRLHCGEIPLSLPPLPTCALPRFRVPFPGSFAEMGGGSAELPQALPANWNSRHLEHRHGFGVGYLALV